MTKVDSVQICGLDPCILSSFKVENSLPDTLDLNSFDEAKCDMCLLYLYLLGFNSQICSPYPFKF